MLAHDLPPALHPGIHPGAPTGFRRLTPSLLRADHAAEEFDGLPDGVTVPGQLLAALKAAAPRLGLSPRLVHAVDWPAILILTFCRLAGAFVSTPTEQRAARGRGSTHGGIGGGFAKASVSSRSSHDEKIR